MSIIHRPVHRPTIAQIDQISSDLGITLDSKSIEKVTDQISKHLEYYDLIKSMPDNLPTVKYPRTSGYEVPCEDNKYGAWYYKTEIKGANNGPLVGKRIVIKDNICVAGVPMMNGSIVLEGYVPTCF